MTVVVPMAKQQEIKPKEEMLKLAATTQFGGPGYILESRFLTERWIWFFVFILLASLTVHDLYNTISGYIAGPTSTDTTIRFNETMAYNGTTFCVQFSAMKLNWGVDLKKPGQTQRILNTFAAEPDILSMLRSETQADAPSNNSNLVSLVMLTTTMLGNIVRLENVRFSTMDDVDNQWGTTKVVKRKAHIDNETTESIASVYRFYAQRNVSLVELLPVTAKLVLRQMFATLYCVRRAQQTTVVQYTLLYNESNITWFGRVPFGLTEERLCFQPKDGALIFGSSADGCMLKISPTAIYPHGSDSGVSGSVMFDLSGHNVPQGDVTNMWGLGAGDKQQVDIQLMGKFTSLNRGSENPCDDDESAPDLVDCMGKCRASKIYQMCGCWPLSWWYLPSRPSDARYCTQPTANTTGFQRYVPDLTTPACNDTHFSFVIDDDCAANCRRKCTQMIYIYTQQKMEKSSDSPNNPDDSWENRTIIYMDTPTFIYPETAQSWSFDLGKFFADLGGNISLWLGGSIIGLVHIILTTCRVGVDAKFGRQVKEHEAELTRKVKQNAVARFVQGQPPPEKQREQQQAFFRYALQHALRTFNTRTGGKMVPHNSLNLASVEDEQMVHAIMGHQVMRGNTQPVSTVTSDLTALVERLVGLEKQLEEYKKRLAFVERTTGEVLGQSD